MAEARLTGSQIAKIIDKTDNSQFVKNQAYYEGSNVKILTKTFEGTPDNRVPLPFGRRTVLDIMGYAYRPGYVNYMFDVFEENKEEQILKIDEIFQENDEGLISAEIFQDALVKGESAELMFLDGTLATTNPKFVKIPREQVIFVYEDNVKNELKYSIRYYTSDIINDDGEVYQIKHADVYYKDVIQYFEQKEISNQTLNPQITTQRNTTDKFNSYVFIGEEKHFFGDIPLYPYKINSEKIGVFQPAIKMIDAMDNMTSDSILNALEMFNDSILTLSKKLTDEVIANIKEYRIMDDMGGKEEGNFVEYIQRKMDLNSTIEGFKIYERLYYELIGIPNLTDQRFSTQSGIAILYALIPFENLVSTFQVYFSKGLNYRLKLLNNIYGYSLKAKIEWKRNLPENIAEKINELILLKREGLISTETILNRLPAEIIENPELELEKIKEEKESNMQMFDTRFDEEKIPEEEENKEEEQAE